MSVSKKRHHHSSTIGNSNPNDITPAAQPSYEWNGVYYTTESEWKLAKELDPVEMTRCYVCRRIQDEDLTVLCDGEGCTEEAHLYCLAPVLYRVPSESWFCERCDPQGSTRLLTSYLAEHESLRGVFPQRERRASRVARDEFQRLLVKRVVTWDKSVSMMCGGDVLCRESKCERHKESKTQRENESEAQKERERQTESEQTYNENEREIHNESPLLSERHAQCDAHTDSDSDPLAHSHTEPHSHSERDNTHDTLTHTLSHSERHLYTHSQNESVPLSDASLLTQSRSPTSTHVSHTHTESHTEGHTEIPHTDSLTLDSPATAESDPHSVPHTEREQSEPQSEPTHTVSETHTVTLSPSQSDNVVIATQYSSETYTLSDNTHIALSEDTHTTTHTENVPLSELDSLTLSHIARRVRLYVPIHDGLFIKHHGRILAQRVKREYPVPFVEFLVHFRSGTDGRNVPLTAWIALEEHVCLIFTDCVTPLRAAGNIGLPLQRVLRSQLYFAVKPHVSEQTGEIIQKLYYQFSGELAPRESETDERELVEYVDSAPLVPLNEPKIKRAHAFNSNSLAQTLAEMEQEEELSVLRTTQYLSLPELESGRGFVDGITTKDIHKAAKFMTTNDSSGRKPWYTRRDTVEEEAHDVTNFYRPIFQGIQRIALSHYLSQPDTSNDTRLSQSIALDAVYLRSEVFPHLDNDEWKTIADVRSPLVLFCDNEFVRKKSESSHAVCVNQVSKLSQKDDESHEEKLESADVRPNVVIKKVSLGGWTEECARIAKIQLKDKLEQQEKDREEKQQRIAQQQLEEKGRLRLERIERARLRREEIARLREELKEFLVPSDDEEDALPRKLTRGALRRESDPSHKRPPRKAQRSDAGDDTQRSENFVDRTHFDGMESKESDTYEKGEDKPEDEQLEREELLEEIEEEEEEEEDREEERSQAPDADSQAKASPHIAVPQASTVIYDEDDGTIYESISQSTRKRPRSMLQPHNAVSDEPPTATETESSTQDASQESGASQHALTTPKSTARKTKPRPNKDYSSRKKSRQGKAVLRRMRSEGEQQQRRERREREGEEGEESESENEKNGESESESSARESEEERDRESEKSPRVVDLTQNDTQSALSLQTDHTSSQPPQEKDIERQPQGESERESEEIDWALLFAGEEDGQRERETEIPSLDALPISVASQPAVTMSFKAAPYAHLYVETEKKLQRALKGSRLMSDTSSDADYLKQRRERQRAEQEAKKAELLRQEERRKQFLLEMQQAQSSSDNEEKEKLKQSASDAAAATATGPRIAKRVLRTDSESETSVKAVATTGAARASNNNKNSKAVGAATSSAQRNASNAANAAAAAAHAGNAAAARTTVSTAARPQGKTNTNTNATAAAVPVRPAASCAVVLSAPPVRSVSLPTTLSRPAAVVAENAVSTAAMRGPPAFAATTTAAAVGATAMSMAVSRDPRLRRIASAATQPATQHTVTQSTATTQPVAPHTATLHTVATQHTTQPKAQPASQHKAATQSAVQAAAAQRTGTKESGKSSPRPAAVKTTETQREKESNNNNAQKLSKNAQKRERKRQRMEEEAERVEKDERERRERETVRLPARELSLDRENKRMRERAREFDVVDPYAVPFVVRGERESSLSPIERDRHFALYDEFERRAVPHVPLPLMQLPPHVPMLYEERETRDRALWMIERERERERELQREFERERERETLWRRPDDFAPSVYERLPPRSAEYFSLQDRERDAALRGGFVSDAFYLPATPLDMVDVHVDPRAVVWEREREREWEREREREREFWERERERVVGVRPVVLPPRTHTQTRTQTQAPPAQRRVSDPPPTKQYTQQPQTKPLQPPKAQTAPFAQHIQKKMNAKPAPQAPPTLRVPQVNHVKNVSTEEGEIVE